MLASPGVHYESSGCRKNWLVHLDLKGAFILRECSCLASTLPVSTASTSVWKREPSVDGSMIDNRFVNEPWTIREGLSALSRLSMFGAQGSKLIGTDRCEVASVCNTQSSGLGDTRSKVQSCNGSPAQICSRTRRLCLRSGVPAAPYHADHNQFRDEERKAEGGEESQVKLANRTMRRPDSFTASPARRCSIKSPTSSSGSD